jgi:hypothetical protein
LAQLIDISSSAGNVGSGFGVQLSPPSSVRRTVESLPTAYPVTASTNVSPLSPLPGLATSTHELPPSVVR